MRSGAPCCVFLQLRRAIPADLRCGRKAWVADRDGHGDARASDSQMGCSKAGDRPLSSMIDVTWLTLAVIVIIVAIVATA